MRILYIVNDLAYFRGHRENIANALAKEGHQVTVAAGDWEGVNISDWPPNMVLQKLRMDNYALRLHSDLNLVRTLARLLRDIEPDVVHAITIKPILMSALAARFSISSKMRSKIKFVWTFAGLGKVFEASDSMSAKARKSMVVSALRYCAKALNLMVTFENHTDRDTIVGHSIVSENQTRVLWGTGLSLEEYKPTRQEGKREPLVFLMATRLIRQKGVDVYLKAAEMFSTHPAKPKFLLAGIHYPANPDNVDPETINAAVSAGHIEFLGQVSKEDMPALYNQSDIFCLPTRYGEGFPRSLLEAAACGCALIASDQEMNRQLVKPDETGWLLVNPDGESLSEAIKLALLNLRATKSLGQKAYKLVRSLKVSDKDIVNEFESIYFCDTQQAESSIWN